MITGWNWQAIKYKGLQIALGGLIIAFACDTLGYSAWNAINDHWTYGAYPTTHLSAQFGHGGLSHIVAFTDARKVEIIEIVNNHTNVYVATISSSDRRIVTLNVEDVNSDGRADLLIQIDGVKQEPCLLNTGKGFEWSVSR